MVEIRRFEEPDAQGWVEILNQDNPDPATAENIIAAHKSDASLPFAVRFVGQLDGQVVGIARLTWMDSQTLWGFIKVHQDFRARGFAKQLAKALEPYIADRKPIGLKTFVQDSDYEQYHGWAERRGFQTLGQAFLSELDLRSFDGGQFQQALKRLEAKNIQILTLQPPLDGATTRRIHQLLYTVMQDEPTGDTIIPSDYQDFDRFYLQAEKVIPLAWFVATLGQEWVGLTYLSKPDWGKTELETSGTGVLPSYRGQGIAKALKVYSALRAKELGFSMIYTGNDTRNAPMLAINTALGFVRKSGGWTMKCSLE